MRSVGLVALGVQALSNMEPGALEGPGSGLQGPPAGASSGSFFEAKARTDGHAPTLTVQGQELIPYRVERLIGSKDERYRLYSDTSPDGPFAGELQSIKYVAARTADTEIILPTTLHNYCLFDDFPDKPGNTNNLYWHYISTGVDSNACFVQVKNTRLASAVEDSQSPGFEYKLMKRISVGKTTKFAETGRVRVARDTAYENNILWEVVINRGMTLRSKRKEWNAMFKKYVKRTSEDFANRVRLPSPKNFQLFDEEGKLALQFGLRKAVTGRYTYILDMNGAISARDGFAIALVANEITLKSRILGQVVGGVKRLVFGKGRYGAGPRRASCTDKDCLAAVLTNGPDDHEEEEEEDSSEYDFGAYEFVDDDD